MAYQVPSLEDMLGFLVALFKGLLPDRNVSSRYTFNWKLLKTIAGAVTDVHANVANAVKDVMPDTSKGAALDRWIGIFAPGGSKKRKGATPARKSAAGRVRGTLAATSAIGDQLIHRSTGLLFQINSLVTIGGTGFVDADILAISTGSATRLKKGEILEYQATPAGLQTKVELQKDLDEDGTDSEQDGAASARLLAALSTPAAGGNQADYVGWVLAQLGYSQAFCYPNRAGVGTLDAIGLHSGTGTARIANAGEVAALLAVLQVFAPAELAGAGGGLRVLTAIGGNLDPLNLANVEVTVTPQTSAPQYAFDWDDAVGAPVVLAYTPGTRTVQLSAPRPATMQAGHRVCFKGVASSQDGAPFVIESLSGADSFVLQTAPTNNLIATDLVYAGGPLTSTIRDAILAHINGDVLYAGPSGPLPGAIAGSTTNLELLLDGIGTANPAGAYGPWRGGLMLGALAQIATYTRGVRKHTVIAPVADLEAVDYAYPNDAQIGLLTPGYVLVRRG